MAPQFGSKPLEPLLNPIDGAFDDMTNWRHWRKGLSKHWLLIVLVLALCATGGCKEGPWTLWDAYQARFIDAPGPRLRPHGGDRTTSEGQAYALFFALADNDRPAFDRILAWTQANLASAISPPICRPGCGARTRTANGEPRPQLRLRRRRLDGLHAH